MTDGVMIKVKAPSQFSRDSWPNGSDVRRDKWMELEDPKSPTKLHDWNWRSEVPKKIAKGRPDFAQGHPETEKNILVF